MIVRAKPGEKLPRPKTDVQRRERAELREEAMQEKIAAKYPDLIIK